MEKLKAGVEGGDRRRWLDGITDSMDMSLSTRRHKRHGFDPLVGKIPWKNGMAIFLPGESPWTEKPGGLKFIGLKRVGHN